MAKDLLTEYQQEELKRLSRFVLSPLQRLVLSLIALSIGILALLFVATAPADRETTIELEQALTQSDQFWAQDMARDYAAQADWLARRGTSIEESVFNRIAFRALSAAERIEMSSRSGGTTPSVTTQTMVFVLGAVLRACFLLIAASRLILIFVLWGWWASRRRADAYKAADALGEAGNGRLFFSGVKISLDDADSDGELRSQITGLASPKRIQPRAFQATELARVLTEFDASSEINRALGSIILAYPELPDHIAYQSDLTQFNHFYEQGALSAYVPALLRSVLETKQHMEQTGTAPESPDLITVAGQASNVSQADYTRLIGTTFGVVLAPRQRAAAIGLTNAEIATVILALEAGKCMVFGVESNLWLRRSRFPELAARSVLHSCAEWSRSYSSALRNRIRRAIVFAGEPSSFAPMRMPMNLPDETLALKALAKLVLCIPHELPIRAAQEELSGLLAHVHIGFEKLFFSAGSQLDPELLDEAFLAGNGLFLPYERIRPLLEQSTDRLMVERIHELSAFLHQHRLSMENTDQETGPTAGSHDVLLPPLSDDQINALAAQFRMEPGLIRDWSAYRLALFKHGWLSRRVSERTVPNSSLVFAVLRETKGLSDAPLRGIEGCVPLRATRCRDQWGRQWAQRFIEADWARIAENRRDYERLLAGEITDVAVTDGPGDGGEDPMAQGIS